MKKIHWDLIDVNDFWRLADELQERTVEHAKDLFTYAETASPKDLISMLIQYRFFTIYYIPDLALLIARMQAGPLRSFLANVLDDELGHGDPGLAHPRLYDDFLRSIGATDEELDNLALKANIALLDSARAQLIDPAKSAAFGIGLRGMGGECVCQIYLSKFYEHIIKNPYIIERHAQVDWRFWDLHVGEHDIEHREKTRQLIQDEIVAYNKHKQAGQDSNLIADLGAGYYESMTSWGEFWDNIFVAAKTTADNLARTRVDNALNLAATTPSAAKREIRQFHLAIPVHDMDAAKRFYRDVMGGQEGRSTKNFTDFNFYGHHLVLHMAPRDDQKIFDTFTSQFHNETVQVPHFGLNFDWQAWAQLADRIKSHGYEFLDPPHVRMEGLPGEHASMFVRDPSGNALEFKAFRNHDEVFSKVFDPRTKELFGLQELATHAAQTTPVN